MPNYAVYIYQSTDLGPECRIIAFNVGQQQPPSLMTQAEAQSYADAITDPKITKMVLPLEGTAEITAA